MAESNTRDGRFRTRSGGIFLAAATLAFFLSPVLPLANQFGLVGGGFALAVGLLALHARSVLNDTSKLTRFASRYFLMGGLLVLVGVFTQAVSVDHERALHCAELQRTMLGGNDALPALENGRSEPHDAFTALGCRYQSDYVFSILHVS